MPTTNPVPSQDPSDLLFNAGKLDEVLNGTGNSFTDRLGVARRTVAGMNADFDAKLADAESDLNVYRADAAASAAEALGYLNTIRTTSYGAYASDPATDPLGNPPTVGDEYFNTTSNLLKRFNGTTWQASDINTANLAAPSGSSLVGYDTGTVQDVLDNAKPFASYAALRAYTGRAIGVRITAPGVAGFFQRRGTAGLTDNGGTIIIDVAGRAWERIYSAAVNVLWFEADPIGVTSSTQAFQKAIDTLRSKRTSPPGYSGWGVGAMDVPKGKYIIDASLIINSALGMLIRGEGQFATTILFTSDSAVLFDINTYVNFSVENISINHSPVNSDRETWTNICFSMNGTGGGSKLQLCNVSTQNFYTIIKCEGIVNEDTTCAEHSTFIDCTIFYDSLNSQGIINTFSNCTWYGYIQYVFYVAGGWQTLIQTGNVVMTGTFIKYRNVIGKYNDRGFTIVNTKFEWTAENSVFGSAPKIIDAEGDQIQVNVTLIDTSIQGGPTPAADARWGLINSSFVNINITSGVLEGKLEIKNRSGNLLSRASRVYFDRAVVSPANMVFTDTGVSGAAYPNVNFKDCKVNDSMLPVNLTLCKAPATPWSDANRVVCMHGSNLTYDGFYTGTFDVDYPTYGQSVWVNSVKFFSRAGNGASQIVNVYSDSARTILIGTITLPASGSIANKMHEVALTSHLVTEGIYLQVVTSNNISGHFIVDFTSV